MTAFATLPDALRDVLGVPAGDMRQAAANAGKTPHWFPGPKCDDPSRRSEPVSR